ncbi:MAG: NAD(P)-dependent oxidoreductase [Thermoplasmata archaeon]|jgi:nucleoside-diphosphate-sugar epimerase|nr:NAD(P)-dependent oxidoreductase [Thermoplasmata archaeon]
MISRASDMSESILVTGATGKVGSHLVPRLLAQGLQVRVLVRPGPNVQQLRDQGAEIAEGDLLQAESLVPALREVEIVVHLAAFFRGATPEQAREVNLVGTEHLAAAAQQAGVRKFIFASTSNVYPSGLSRPAREDDSPSLEPPSHPYPASKVAAEAKLMELDREAGIGLCILRLGFVYGEGDRHVWEMMPHVAGWNPARRMHSVHHADVGQAVIRALDRGTPAGKVFNIADDAPITLLELSRLARLPEPPVERSALTFDPWEGLLDTRRAREDLGFRPIYPSCYSALAAGTF